MRYRSKLIPATCIALLTVVLVPMSNADDKTPAAASASPTQIPSLKETKTKPTEPIPFHGTISAVDQTRKIFVIADKTSMRVFKITDKTTFTKSGAAATMKDIMQHEEVSGSYWKAADGSFEAKTVKLDAMASGKKKAAKKADTERSTSTTKKNDHSRSSADRSSRRSFDSGGELGQEQGGAPHANSSDGELGGEQGGAPRAAATPR